MSDSVKKWHEMQEDAYRAEQNKDNLLIRFFKWLHTKKSSLLKSN